MRKVKQLLIYLILSVLLVISCVNYEFPEADNYEKGVSGEYTDFLISSAAIKKTQDYVCTIQVFNQEKALEVQYVVRENKVHRNDIRNVFEFLCTEQFFSYKTALKQQLEAKDLVYKHMNELVVYYLHKSDGKKKI